MLPSSLVSIPPTTCKSISSSYDVLSPISSSRLLLAFLNKSSLLTRPPFPFHSQRRFKRIVEQHGFKLVNNQVLSADSADARPITNLPASSRHIETPHNSSPAGGTKKASRGVKATSASPTTPTTSKQADTVVDDREAARPTNAKKRAASADAEGHQAATIRATKKAKKESTDDKAANTSNKGNTKVVNKKSGDTTLPIAPKKNSKEVVEAEGNTEDEE